MSRNKGPRPVGEYIMDEVFEPDGYDVEEAAKLMDIDERSLSSIIGGAPLTAEIAEKIEETFDLLRGNLMHMQAVYNKWHAKS